MRICMRSWATCRTLQLIRISDVSRFRNWLRRPKSKANIINESRVKSCLAKFDNGCYSRLQFLCAVSHSMGAHMAALQPADNDNDDDGSYTNYDVHGATHCGRCSRGHHLWSGFGGTARRVRVGTLRTCALLRQLREHVAASPRWCAYSCRRRHCGDCRELWKSDASLRNEDNNWFWTVCAILRWMRYVQTTQTLLFDFWC